VRDHEVSSIAYVTTYDSTQPGSWSGIGYRMPLQLEAEGVSVERIGPLKAPRHLEVRLRSGLAKAISGKRYLSSRAPAVLDSYARQVTSQLADLRVDVILSPGTIPIAHLETEVPLVFWTDATFGGLVDFYAGFSNLAPRSLQEGHALEQAALDRCSLALYSSPWAVNTALDHYDVDESKLRVIPFGPSLDVAPGSGDIEGIIIRRLRRPLKLLFIGTDWRRKGGDRALSVTAALMRAGIDVELHIVGVRLPGPIPAVVEHGYVPSRTQEGRHKLAGLLADANFLLLPTRADCLPVVLAEACAWALPSLVTRVGGIPTVYTDGVEGHLFDLDSSEDDYVDVIRHLLQNPAEYDALCRRARSAYDDRLNWPHAAREALRLMKSVLGSS